jgi:uncharacterized protein with PQ loop repeat
MNDTKSLSQGLLILGQVFGYLGLVQWTIPILPQIVKNYRLGSTDGLSPALYITNAVSTCLFAAFALSVDLAIPALLQPHAYALCCTIVLAQTMYYRYKAPLFRTIVALMVMVVVWVGGEVGLYNLLLLASSNDVQWVALVIGIVSAALAFFSFLPQIYTTFVTKDASGLSPSFIGLTVGGGIFFLLSLFFQNEAFNWIAASLYIGVTLCASALGVLFLVYEKRRRSKEMYQVDDTVTAEFVTGGMDQPNRRDTQRTLVDPCSPAASLGKLI